MSAPDRPDRRGTPVQRGVLSPRLREVVEALPLRPGMRVLEVGGAPGAAAREVVRLVSPGGFVLVIDRSPRGIELTRRACAEQISQGSLGVRLGAVEEAGSSRVRCPTTWRSPAGWASSTGGIRPASSSPCAGCGRC